MKPVDKSWFSVDISHEIVDNVRDFVDNFLILWISTPKMWISTCFSVEKLWKMEFFGELS